MIEAVYKAYNQSLRWWRQYLYWGLVFNTVAGFWVLMVIAQYGNADQMGSLLTLYGTNLTATMGAAGLRHMDKKLELEMQKTGSKDPEESPAAG